MSRKKNFPFEESLAQLEELVEKMERGDLSLEESLRAFEQGIKLTRDCQAALKEAEQTVKLLLQKRGVLVEADFLEDSDSDE